MSDRPIQVGKRRRETPWKVTHGKSKTPTYRIWVGMMSRCYRAKPTEYRLYQGRGIRVCKRWHQFVNFLSDMGERPSGKVLDRRDNNGNYTPRNCRWASPKESSNNTRWNRLVTMNGETMSLTMWCRKLGIPYGRVHGRVYAYGWSPIVALTAPLHVKSKHWIKRTKDEIPTGEKLEA